MEKPVILRADHLKKHFAVTKGLLIMKVIGWVKAVDDISFTIRQGETLALVGESGCGKTTTAKLILRLETPTAGQVFVNGKDVHTLRGNDLKDYRTMVQAVFQDPWSSLNPRMRVRDIVAEPLVINGELSAHEVRARVAETLARLRAVMSRIALIATGPASVSTGLSEISTGNSRPSLRKPNSSSPAPIGRMLGAWKKPARSFRLVIDRAAGSARRHDQLAADRPCLVRCEERGNVSDLARVHHAADGVAARRLRRVVALLGLFR